jgi:hypothetical protein
LVRCCFEPAGYNTTTGQTFICPVTTYKSFLGSSSCTSCGSGLLTASTGSTSYSDCCEWQRFICGDQGLRLSATGSAQLWVTAAGEASLVMHPNTLQICRLF